MQGLGRHVVFVDSNVLYSRTTRDWLGLLYTEGDLFTVCWSEEVLADVIHHLRKDHPTWDGAKTARVHDRIAETFEIGRVADFTVDGTYQGGDPDDAHVHAAALACQADILLTCNTRHFVWEGSDAYYDTMTPDEFFVLVDDAAPAVVRRGALRHLPAKHLLGQQDERGRPVRTARRCVLPGVRQACTPPPARPRRNSHQRRAVTPPSHATP